MSKTTDRQHESEMLDEYDFSQGVRGKYYQQYRNNNLKRLKGIQFFADAHGRKIGALIDLKQHQALWHDVLNRYDHPAPFHFLIDDRGEKKAVILDFKKHLEIWENIYDNLIAELID
ncbi:MAG: hypothetical protein AB4426_29990 [Xenococcaceae cyanobacterium]